MYAYIYNTLFSLKMFIIYVGIPGGTNGEKPSCQCRKHKKFRLDFWVGKISWRKPWLLQYCCLEDAMDRGTWQAIVQVVKELDTTEVL